MNQKPRTCRENDSAYEGLLVALLVCFGFWTAVAYLVMAWK